MRAANGFSRVSFGTHPRGSDESNKKKGFYRFLVKVLQGRDPALEVIGCHMMKRRSFRALWVVTKCFPSDATLTSALCNKEKEKRLDGEQTKTQIQKK